MIIISDYRLEGTTPGGFICVHSKEMLVCSVCREELTVRGNCERGVIWEDGRKEKIIIRRLQCTKCKRIHHELPDCLVPYKRHCAETVEKIVSGSHDDAPCEERTIGRILEWWHTVGTYLLQILETIFEKLKIPMPEKPLFKGLVRAAANTNNWTFVNLICTRSVVSSA